MEKTYEEKVKSLRRGSIIWAIIYGFGFYYSHNLLAIIPLALLIGINILIPQKNRNGAILEKVFGWCLMGSGIICLILLAIILIAMMGVSGASGLIGTAGIAVGSIGILFYGIIAVLSITAGRSTVKEAEWFLEKIDSGDTGDNGNSGDNL